MKDDGPQKASARTAFRDFVKRTRQQDLGNLNDKQRSQALAQFYVEEVHNRLRTFISTDEFEAAFVDASGDLGADFIHRDDNLVTIIQTKYVREGGNVSVQDIQHFQTIFDRLLNSRFKPNTKVADAIASIDFDRDTFVLRFVALGQIVGQGLEQTRTQPHLPPNLADRISFEWIDEPALTEELRSAYSLSGGIPGDCVLVSQGRRGKRGPILELTSGGYRSFLLVVAAPQIVHLYQQHRDRLFTLNIRNYIGSTVTNKGIISTGKEEPGNFFHFNNGISCLGTDVQVAAEGDRLTVKGLQVINGAQTVKALFRASQQKDVWRDDEPLVVVRVTEVSKGYGAEGRFANQVIRFNNTQNVIKASDFKSNDPVQNDLVAKFKRLMRFGRSVEYIPKRIEPSRRNAWLIRMEEFAKVVYSFLKNPIDFSGSTSFLFDESEKGGYAHAFGDGRFPYSPTMPEDAFRLRSAIWWMSEAFSDARKADREKSADAAERGALERKWMLIYAARLVLERSFGEAEYQNRLAKFWKGEWELGKGEDGKLFSQLYENSKAALIFVYEQSMKKSTFVPRNWMRSEETLNDLRSFIKRAPGMALK